MIRGLTGAMLAAKTGGGGYEYFDYVYNNGTHASASLPDGKGAYIDTGYIPTSGIDISFSFRCLHFATDSVRTAIIGQLASAVYDSRSFCFQEISLDSAWTLINNTDTRMATKTNQHTSVEITNMHNYKITVDGGSVVSGVIGGSNFVRGAGPFYYGCTYYEGSHGPVWHGEMNLGRLTIKNNITFEPIVDFIPCRRKSDGLFGFHEIVSDTFYGSENDIPFSAEKGI